MAENLRQDRAGKTVRLTLGVTIGPAANSWRSVSQIPHASGLILTSCEPMVPGSATCFDPDVFFAVIADCFQSVPPNPPV